MSASRILSLAATLVALSVIAASCAKDASGPQPPAPPAPPAPPGAPPPAPPPPPFSGVTLYAAGNITACNPGNHDEATANLMMRDTTAWKVVVLGDMARNGTEVDFQGCYHPSWGQFKDRSYPVLGNHEYDQWEWKVGAVPPYAAGDTIRKANGAFAYWGAQLQPGNSCPSWAPRCGYYAVDHGSWRILVLNDQWNRCVTGNPGGTDNCAEDVHAGPGSDYFIWVNDQLTAAKAANKCTLVAFHSPRFFSSTSPGFTTRDQRRTLWNVLDPGGADIVVNGQEHHYERMAPMRADGTPDDTKIRQFNVGTGGESMTNEAAIVAMHPSSEKRMHIFGMLRLTLGETSYKWAFIPDDGSPAADTGTGQCH